MPAKKSKWPKWTHNAVCDVVRVWSRESKCAAVHRKESVAYKPSGQQSFTPYMKRTDCKVVTITRAVAGGLIGRAAVLAGEKLAGVRK
jgi:hypothetical protein